jgi:hypothetical protein
MKISRKEDGKADGLFHKHEGNSSVFKMRRSGSGQGSKQAGISAAAR